MFGHVCGGIKFPRLLEAEGITAATSVSDSLFESYSN